MIVFIELHPHDHTVQAREPRYPPDKGKSQEQVLFRIKFSQSSKKAEMDPYINKDRASICHILLHLSKN